MMSMEEPGSVHLRCPLIRATCFVVAIKREAGKWFASAKFSEWGSGSGLHLFGCFGCCTFTQQSLSRHYLLLAKAFVPLSY